MALETAQPKWAHLLRDSSSHSVRRFFMSLEAPSPYTLARMPRALQASRSSASLRASSPSALMARSSSCGQVTWITWLRMTYVGAACHPQPRVTGVANSLKRRPCFEGEFMLWYVVSQNDVCWSRSATSDKE